MVFLVLLIGNLFVNIFFKHKVDVGTAFAVACGFGLGIAIVEYRQAIKK